MGKVLSFSQLHLDALREVGSIGAGNASTALSQFINQKVEMAPPEVTTLTASDIPSFVSKGFPIITMVVIEVEGDIGGYIFFIFDEKNAVMMIDLLMGQEPGSTSLLSEIGVSALKEVSNVMSGSYLQVLGDMINLTLTMTPPYFTAGSPLEIPKFISEHCIKEQETTICLKSNLSISKKFQVYGSLVFIPAAASLGRLINLLGIPNEASPQLQ
ncbi:MAG: chemotaxis protein CheC [Candidatus Omnitrophica bacterium]|nr:chemotaxis protein CheC [Candidatus Omnitrophota bacterium]